MAGEDRVMGDVDLDVQVAGRAAARADLALAGQLDAVAGVDARRDLDVDRAASPDPAVAGALAARVGDDGAEAAAGRARAHRAHLAEERPLHVADLAAAAAGRAGRGGRARRRAGAAAQRAEHGGVDLELLGDAERRLAELELDPDQRVLAAAHARTRTALPGALAEERVHDVGEREALAEAAGPAAPTAGRRRGRTSRASWGRSARRTRG